jgi:hypothetical protein
MGYRGLNSFDEVAKRYNEIKPIRGRKEDTRPLNERRYAWNRIIKVDDNKYILSDGHYTWWGQDTLETVSPIVWERKEDGDYMTIRNNMNDSSAVSRYQFISHYLPLGMSFDWYNISGKHFVKYKDQTHYLPKYKGTFDYNAKVLTIEKDNKLVFKHVDGEFIRANELQPMKTRRLDKDLDKEYNKKLMAMWEWMQIVLPVLGDTMYEGRTTYADSFGGSYWYWTKRTTPEEVREILNDEEHPKRMAFAVLASIEADAMRDKRFEPKTDSYKKLRMLVRRIGDFYKTELA